MVGDVPEGVIFGDTKTLLLGRVLGWELGELLLNKVFLGLVERVQFSNDVFGSLSDTTPATLSFVLAKLVSKLYGRQDSPSSYVSYPLLLVYHRNYYSVFYL